MWWLLFLRRLKIGYPALSTAYHDTKLVKIVPAKLATLVQQHWIRQRQWTAPDLTSHPEAEIKDGSVEFATVTRAKKEKTISSKDANAPRSSLQGEQYP